MQEFKILLWCDRHGLRAEQVPATTTVPLSMPGFPDREIDLCDACHDVLFTELLEVTTKAGRPAGGSPAPPRPAGRPPVPAETPQVERDGIPCPACVYVAATAKNLNSHWRDRHTEEIGNLGALYGTTCPICGQPDLGNLGVHANRAHGASGIAGAFLLAERSGDEHGAVRTFRKRLADARAAGPLRR